MVNDTIDLAANIIDYNLDASTIKTTKQQQKQEQEQTLKYSTITKKQKVVQTSFHSRCQDVQNICSNSQVLPENAANLSWTFFEKICELDNQLRDDEELSVPQTNGCHSKTTSPTNIFETNKDIDDTELLMNRSLDEENKNSRKQNDFTSLTKTEIAKNSKTKVCDQLLSQKSPDLIQKPQSELTQSEFEQETGESFQFTSPTATFKRRKKQQQQQQQQQQQHQQQKQPFEYQIHNNNNNGCGNQKINNSQTIEQQQQQTNKLSASPTSAPSVNVQHAKTTSISFLLNAADAASTSKPKETSKTATTTTPKAKTTQTKIVDDILGVVATVVGDAGVSHVDNITKADEATITATTTTTLNQRLTSNRTLPRISTTTATTQPRSAYAVDTLDLVASKHKSKTTTTTPHTPQANGYDKRQRGAVKVKQTQLQQQQQQQQQQQHKQEKTIFKHRSLPKRMTAGAAAAAVAAAAATNCSSASESASGSNNSNHSSNTSHNNNNNNNNNHNTSKVDKASGGVGVGVSNTYATHNDTYMDNLSAHLELVGWRKKCLYGLLLLLMLLIITNLVMTLWILKVMDFTLDGMGQLKIVPGGIQLTGQALIMDMLRASTIRSRHGHPIAIESSRNFSINTRDANGMLENYLFLGHDKLECLAKEIRINDTNGRNLFSVNQNEVTIGAHALRIDGEGGAIFRESIQTPHVRAEPGRELRLESPTRQLELSAAKDINLLSRAGAIEVTALRDVRLSALDGSLRLESSKILMPNLRTAQPPALGAPQSREHLHRVFQLCACSNGKLFLAAPHSICAGDDSTVCR